MIQLMKDYTISLVHEPLFANLNIATFLKYWVKYVLNQLDWSCCTTHNNILSLVDNLILTIWRDIRYTVYTFLPLFC